MGSRADGRRSKLIGRQAELARIDALVDRLRQGKGGALRIDGEPGRGKSALLDAAVPEDLLCLRLTGVEIELELPLAGLDELLEALPNGLGEDRTGSDPAERLRGAAARIKAAAPLLILVDDLQWLDPSTRGAITYIARRAEQLGVGLIGAWSLRGEQPDAWPGVELLHLAELSPIDSFELARRQGVADPVAESIARAVGGNPLALIEAPASLNAAQQAGREMLPDQVPVGVSLQNTFERRLSALDERTREHLLLAAVGAPSSQVAEHLEPAEDLGLVQLGTEIEFIHPLIRSAVYHSALPSARRQAHRAVATMVVDPERTRQLALAATGPDEQLAVELERLANQAVADGAPGTAAVMLERSVGLTANGEQRNRRALVGARVALLAGRPVAAQGLLDMVENAGEMPAEKLLRGVAIYMAGRPQEARLILEREARRVESTDPALSSLLLVQACVALMGPGPMSELEHMATRALELAPEDGRAIPGVILASALAVLGPTGEARRLLDEYEPDLESWDPVGPGHEVLAVAGFCRLWLGDLAQARQWLERLVEVGRARGADSVMAAPLAILAGVLARSGQLEAAESAAREAIEIVETGLGGFGLTLALSSGALIAASRGDESTCRELAARLLELGEQAELASTLAAAEQALGMLELSLGNGESAAEHLGQAAAHLEVHGTVNPAFLLTDADLVEALLRAGCPGEAQTVFERLERTARLTGGRWENSAVERCRGLLGPVDEMEARLEASLALLGDDYMLLEAARTRLVIAERMRRERMRSAARVQLDQAQKTFDRIGASAWADRTGRELAATQGVDSTDDLTSRERDVCELVAGGATNREVAARLFISPRTVEHHLRAVYRKLGIRSRSELAANWRS